MAQVTLGGTFEFNNEEVTIPVDPFQNALDYDYTVVFIKTNPYQGGYYIFYAYSQEPFKFSSFNNGLFAKNTLVIRRYTTYDSVFVDFYSYTNPDSTTWGLGLAPSPGSTIVYTNYDIVDVESDDVVYPSNAVNYPFFDNTNNDVTNSSFEYIFITTGSYDKNEILYFHLLTVTNYVAANEPIYYYNDRIFHLDKDSSYFRIYNDDSDKYYYCVPRYELSLQPNTSYVYLLSNSSEIIDNSYGQLEKDTSNGIFDVLTADTTGIITQAQADSDNFRKMEQTLQEQKDNQESFQNTMLSTEISNETNNDVDTSLNYNNNNQEVTTIRQGFFTRLSIMLANLVHYNINQDTAVVIPVPFTNKSITLHSIDINNNVTGTFRTIVDLFWVFIFSFYMYKFINHLYISITTGKILRDFNATNETITNHML